jgi:predicted transcriptional regulator
MARTPRDVTEAELNILRVLWERGPSSVRTIVDVCETEGAATHAATVQKLLERLEAKAWVDRDRSEAIQRFRATADRDELIGRRLQGIAEELCEGSLTPLISHLVKREQWNGYDKQVLRDLIEQLDKTDKGKRKKLD